MKPSEPPYDAPSSDRDKPKSATAPRPRKTDTVDNVEKHLGRRVGEGQRGTVFTNEDVFGLDVAMEQRALVQACQSQTAIQDHLKREAATRDQRRSA